MARRPPSLATRPRRVALLQRQRVGRPPQPARGKARLPRRSDPHPPRRREARTRRLDQGQPRNSCLGPPPGSLPHQVERRRPAAERRNLGFPTEGVRRREEARRSGGITETHNEKSLNRGSRYRSKAGPQNRVASLPVEDLNASVLYGLVRIGRMQMRCQQEATFGQRRRMMKVDLPSSGQSRAVLSPGLLETEPHTGCLARPRTRWTDPLAMWRRSGCPTRTWRTRPMVHHHPPELPQLAIWCVVSDKGGIRRPEDEAADSCGRWREIPRLKTAQINRPDLATLEERQTLTVRREGEPGAVGREREIKLSRGRLAAVGTNSHTATAATTPSAATIHGKRRANAVG